MISRIAGTASGADGTMAAERFWAEQAGSTSRRDLPGVPGPRSAQVGSAQVRRMEHRLLDEETMLVELVAGRQGWGAAGWPA